MENEDIPAPEPAPEFSNPPVADGINNPPQRPVRTLFTNLLLVGAGLVVVLLALNVAAGWLAPLFPFRWERALVSPKLLQSRLDSHGEAKQKALRELMARMTAKMSFPEDMRVTLYYNPGSTVNAFATFGGNVIVFQGLLDLVGSEDELAMVLAHEAAHVKHRDSVKGVVRLGGLLLLGSGLEDSANYIDSLLDIGLSGYSREQEEAADVAAVAALGAEYGHAGGAEAFFTTLAEKVEKRSTKGKAASGVGGLTASHPDTLLRLQRAGEEAGRLGIPKDGERTPLPAVLDKNEIFIGKAGGSPAVNASA